VVLGHGLHERLFGGGGGLVLVAEGGEEVVKVGLAFRGKHPEGAGGGEAMTEIVARGGGLAGCCLRTGRELRICLIGGDLRCGSHTPRVSPGDVRREGSGAAENVESYRVNFISENCDRLAKLVAGGANLGNGRGLWGLNRGDSDVRAREGFKHAAAGSWLRKRRMLLKNSVVRVAFDPL
jgi:hypothetical protein